MRKDVDLLHGRASKRWGWLSPGPETSGFKRAAKRARTAFSPSQATSITVLIVLSGEGDGHARTGQLAKIIRPPCISTRPLTIGSPNPVPRSVVVMSGRPCPRRQKLCWIFRAMPMPVSETQSRSRRPCSVRGNQRPAGRRVLDRIRQQIVENLPHGMNAAFSRGRSRQDGDNAYALAAAFLAPGAPRPGRPR